MSEELQLLAVFRLLERAGELLEAFGVNEPREERRRFRASDEAIGPPLEPSDVARCREEGLFGTGVEPHRAVSQGINTEAPFA